MDPTFSSRCTHLLCESQVSSAYAQVSAVASALTVAGSVPSRGPSKGSRDECVWTGFSSASESGEVPSSSLWWDRSVCGLLALSTGKVRVTPGSVTERTRSFYSVQSSADGMGGAEAGFPAIVGLCTQGWTERL